MSVLDGVRIHGLVFVFLCFCVLLGLYWEKCFSCVSDHGIESKRSGITVFVMIDFYSYDA